MTKRVLFLCAVLAAFTVSAMAASQTWSNVPVVDVMCKDMAKDHPEKHTTKCALQCQKSGYGILTSNGDFLKFDAAGNKQVLEQLKGTKKTDNLKVNVTGEQDGKTIKVETVSLQ